MSNPAEIIVLAEDARQASLVRNYLRFRLPDLPGAVIRFRAMADDRGSGEQRVRSQYEQEVRAHLLRHSRKWLIIVTDADANSVPARLKQLAQCLAASSDERVRRCRIEREQIAQLIPKWSVETWILCLNAETVNEDEPYKRSNRDFSALTRPAAATLHQWVSSAGDPPPHCVPSLHHGIKELRRLTR